MGMDGTCQRMLGVGLDRTNQPQHGLERATVGRRRPGDPMLAPRERPRLVEQHRVDAAHRLERQTVLHQDAGARRLRGRDRGHQRDGQPGSVRTGDDQNGDRHPLDRLVGAISARIGDPLGLVRQQLGKRRECTAGLADRTHLDPVAKQHHGDQQRHLPPDLRVEESERRRQRGDVGDGDRHRDQHHHPRPPRPRLCHRTHQERPSTDEEDDGAQHRSDQDTASERWHRVAEPVLDHR